VFCPNCGTQVVPGKRFCGQCGSEAADSASTTVPAPSVAAVRAFPTGGKPMSVLVAILITVALLVICIASSMAMAGEHHAEGAVGLMVLASAIWASQDASRIGLKQYKARLAGGPVGVFFAMWLLWIIAFPWYLVVRSRIKAGVMPKNEHVGSTSSAPRVLGWICGVMVLVALLSAALFIGAGGSVKGIWQQNGSQVKAAEASPQTVAVPVVSTTPDVPHEPTSIIGVYQRDQSGTLEIKQLTNGKLGFSLDATLVVNAATGDVRTGEASGEIELIGNTATYIDPSDADCKIKMIFERDKGTIAQEGTCGFGLNVAADGIYLT
jgi:hypothetical protein